MSRYVQGLSTIPGGCSRRISSTVCLYLLDLKLTGSSWKFDDGRWQNFGVSNTQFLNRLKHLKESFVHSQQLKKENIENETNSTNQKTYLELLIHYVSFPVFPPVVHLHVVHWYLPHRSLGELSCWRSACPKGRSLSISFRVE